MIYIVEGAHYSTLCKVVGALFGWALSRFPPQDRFVRVVVDLALPPSTIR